MTEGMKPSLLHKLGLSRRAGVAEIGQDRIRTALSAGKGPLLLFLSNDASSAVKRRLLSAASKRGDRIVHLDSVSRWELGAALGLASAQVVGLPLGSHFAEMLLEDLRREGDVIE